MTKDNEGNIQHAIDKFHDNYSHLIGNTSFNEDDFPKGCCRCLNPRLQGQNDNIINDINDFDTWKHIEIILKETGPFPSFFFLLCTDDVV